MSKLAYFLSDFLFILLPDEKTISSMWRQTYLWPFSSCKYVKFMSFSRILSHWVFLSHLPSFKTLGLSRLDVHLRPVLKVSISINRFHPWTVAFQLFTTLSHSKTLLNINNRGEDDEEEEKVNIPWKRGLPRERFDSRWRPFQKVCRQRRRQWRGLTNWLLWMRAQLGELIGLFLAMRRDFLKWRLSSTFFLCTDLGRHSRWVQSCLFHQILGERGREWRAHTNALPFPVPLTIFIEDEKRSQFRGDLLVSIATRLYF